MPCGHWDSGLAVLSQSPFGEGQAPFPKVFHLYLGLTQLRQVGGAVAQHPSLDQVPWSGSVTISKAGIRRLSAGFCARPRLTLHKRT